MFHHFFVPLFGTLIYVHTYTFMMELYAIFSVVAFTLFFRKEKLMARALLLSVITAVFAFFGARLFHLLFEKPLSDFAWQQMFEFDGMTYYGSLIAGVAVAFAGTMLLFPKSAYLKVLDFSAMVAAFGYDFLRLGCFANGCCWGRLTSVPWAVRYSSGSEMPYIGLPVHPVQIYDSICGFLIFAILVRMDRHRERRGLLMPVFLVLSSIGRFITEFYRGDAYRGTNVMFHLSMSQTIAVFLFIIGVVWIVLVLKPQSRMESHI